MTAVEPTVRPPGETVVDVVLDRLVIPAIEQDLRRTTRLVGALFQADLDDAPDSPHLSGAGWARLMVGDVWLRDAQVDAFSGPGPLITDDRPRTEYFLLRRAFARPSPDISEGLLRQATSGR